MSASPQIRGADGKLMADITKTPSAAPDAEDQEEGVSGCGWSPSPQGAVSDTLAGRAP
jgi:hypothetical protein